MSALMQSGIFNEKHGFEMRGEVKKAKSKGFNLQVTLHYGRT